MTKTSYIQQLITLIGLFDPNVSMSHEVEAYINGLSTIVRNKIKSQMIDSINNNSVTARDIKRIAAFTSSSDLAAMELFTAIYLHAFEGGEEPDIDDYRLERYLIEPSIYLTSLVGLFNVNVAMSDEVPEFINALNLREREKLETEMINRITAKNITVRTIYKMTSFEATDDKIALDFFIAVYRNAFKGEEEPDIDDYRPEWSI